MRLLLETRHVTKSKVIAMMSVRFTSGEVGFNIPLRFFPCCKSFADSRLVSFSNVEELWEAITGSTMG
jgi:hypothetical protein